MPREEKLRFGSFTINGRNSFGAFAEDGIIDLGAEYRDLELGAALRAGLLSEFRAVVAGRKPEIPLNQIRYRPVIPDSQKVFGIGLNYGDHRAETGRADEVEKYPTLFVRFPETHVGHDESLLLPAVSHEFDYEGELAVVIGTEAWRVARDRAMAHVAGYCCYNDGSVRDFQRHTTQFVAGKNFPRTGALGPWLVTADEITDPHDLALTTRLNGEIVQSASTAEMIFDIPALISYLSTWTVLQPGDVIATGTPAGVGSRRNPPRFLRKDDVVEVEIEGVGLLRNRIVAEPQELAS